jgi:hypothetical protein
MGKEANSEWTWTGYLISAAEINEAKSDGEGGQFGVDMDRLPDFHLRPS